MVADGASTCLTSCTASGNKSHGVLVRGEGSVCTLRQVGGWEAAGVRGLVGANAWGRVGTQVRGYVRERMREIW